MRPEARYGLDTEEEAPWAPHWAPIDLGPILRGEVTVEPPTILAREDGVCLLYPGRTNLMMGETESAKTWVALHAMAGELNQGRHVVYLDYEDGAPTAVERLRALGVSEGAIEGLVTYVNPEGRFDDLARLSMVDAIEGRGTPAMVVVDALTGAMRSHSLNPNEGADVEAYYADVPRWFARTGAAVTVLDHVTKNQETRGRWAIGSERKISGLSGAAYAFDVKVPFGRGRTGVTAIVVVKDRPGHVRQHADAAGRIATAQLTSWPDDGVTVSLSPPDADTEDPFRPTQLMGRLSDAIAAEPGLSKRALRAAVTGKAQYVDLALELLVTESYVETRDGPRSARLHYSLKPFSG